MRVEQRHQGHFCDASRGTRREVAGYLQQSLELGQAGRRVDHIRPNHHGNVAVRGKVMCGQDRFARALQVDGGHGDFRDLKSPFDLVGGMEAAEQ